MGVDRRRSLSPRRCIAVVGLFVQQSLLRWNQGQDLRQALITIAISVIIADQIIAHFPRQAQLAGGGNAVSLTWPGWLDRLVDSHIWDVQYSLARLAVLALGVAVGVALWLWLYRTRTGMVIRAGVDDQQMASALGINIQRTFAIAFVVGSALAAFGAVVGASQSNIASGQDGQWLLNSLVVVIVGGMGSIFGAAAGSLLYALVFSFSATYLPTTGANCCTQYSIVFTFVLIAIVLAFRPQGLFGRPAVRRLGSPRNSRGARHRSGCCSCSPPSDRSIFSDYWAQQLLTQTFLMGIAAASLIFLSAYGGNGLARSDGDVRDRGFIVGNLDHEGRAGRRDERAPPRVGSHASPLLFAIVLTTAIGLVFGLVAARSLGIYFLMITLTYAVICELLLRSGDERVRVLGNRRHQPLHAGLDR